MPIPWPSDITQRALRGSYSEHPERNVIEFAPEVGSPKSRRRSAVSCDLMSWDFHCTYAQWKSFRDGFYRRELADGSLTFTRRHPWDLTGPAIEFKFTSEPTMRQETPTQCRVSVSMRSMP